MREDDNRTFFAKDWKMVLILFTRCREWQRPKHIFVEFPYHQHWSLEALTTILFISDVQAKRAPPYLTLMKKRDVFFSVDVFLPLIPPIKIFFGHPSIIENAR